MTTLNETFRDVADRVEVNLKSLPALTPEQVNAHPGGHPNSLAWLLWHSGRVLDVHVAALAGKGEIWNADIKRSLSLGDVADGVGVGHSAAEAAEIKVTDVDPLVDYVAATLDAFRDYVVGIESAGEFDEIIGEFKGAPDTRQARLTFIILDAARHIDQGLYIAGMPNL